MDQQHLNAIRVRFNAYTDAINDPDVDGEPYWAVFRDNAYADVDDLLDETGRLRADLAAMTADRDAWRRRAEAACDDLRMVCTNGEPCAACHHCCDQGPNFPCRILDEWCGGESWEWRGPEEDKQ